MIPYPFHMLRQPDAFEAAINDLLGTDDALTITRDGNPVVVVVDVAHYEMLLERFQIVNAAVGDVLDRLRQKNATAS